MLHTVWSGTGGTDRLVTVVSGPLTGLEECGIRIKDKFALALLREALNRISHAAPEVIRAPQRAANRVMFDV